MPRQVYGKKTRAVYDPSAIFGNSQKSSPSDVREVGVDVLAEEVGKLKITRDNGQKGTGSRTALGERELNVVSGSSASHEREQKRRRGRRKNVEDDDDNDEIRRKAEPAITRPARTKREQQRHTSLNEDVSEEFDPPIETFSLRDSDDTRAITKPVIDEKNAKISPLTPRQSHGSMPSAHHLSEPYPRDEYTDHCAPLLSYSNHPLVEFESWAAQLDSHFHLSKIAEASFGEVYRLSLRKPLPDFDKSDESVFKVIALAPPSSQRDKDADKEELVESSGLSSIEDVTNEIRLLQRMSSIPGFTNFRDIRVVRGRPPEPFISAFQAFDAAQRARGKGGSHFADPALESSHPEDQLWAVLEMQDAGTDLERLVESRSCRNIWRVWDIFWQVVLSLAKGEEAAEFEHRDLHLGNICVRENDDAVAEIDVKRKLGFTNVETTIIDYTISRASIQDGGIAYQDLARDDGIFEGNSEEEYQYDIYRYMRGAVLYGDAYAEPPFPAASPQDPRWEAFHPISNLVWLHFVLYKLLEQISWPSSTKKPAAKRKVEHARWKRGNELETTLLRVQELLDPGLLCEAEGLRSASNLVGLALEESWLGVEDVVGEMEEESIEGVVEQFDELILDENPVEEKQVKDGKTDGPRPRRTRARN